MRRALLLGLLSALCVPAPAYALREVIVGNQPLSPQFGFGLRAAAKTADKDIASICEQVINSIEKSTVEVVPEEEIKKRAAIRKEIREMVEGRGGKGGK